MERLLNVNETAEIQGIAPATLREWIFRRRLPFIKLGSRVLFHPDDIKQFVKQSKVEVPK